jgi:MtN3 and saliva related transmembrane protein
MVYLMLAFPRWIGIIAGVFTTASLLPPLVKLIKDKKPEHVPKGMLIVLLMGLCFWIYYGLLNNDWPILVTNSVSLMQNVAMLTLRHKYKNEQQL